MRRILTFKFQAIAEGALTLLPGGASILQQGTRGSDSARYCYAVWMRHLVKTQKLAEIADCRLGTVVELGPGDSLGTGLAALLCGADRYIAVDAVEHSNPERNLRIFEDLIELFRVGAPIPDSFELPEVKPLLDDYAFPGYIPRNMGPERHNAIVAGLRGHLDKESPVTYLEPNEARRAISAESVHLIFSQAVLEHVDDLESIYRNCFAWLRPGGVMSHQIDFKSHGMSHVWNGHWAYPDPVWKLIRGHRLYLINRQPCGTHLEALKKAGFVICSEERVRLPSRLKREQLAKSFRDMPENDMTTAGVYIVARKM